MSKEEAVEKLKALGFDAELQSGVVMLYVDEKTYQNVKTIEKTLKEIGYRASWGMQVRKEQ